jgi:hypothetical protein
MSGAMGSPPPQPPDGGDIRTVSASSEREKRLRADFHELFTRCPIPADELLTQLGLFLNRQTLSRILFMHDLYRRIVDVQGVVMEFGVRWGQNLALFESFRGMYEPYNFHRRIIGFDTFGGFPSVHERDGDAEIVQVGGYGVTPGYEAYLEQVLAYHEQESPLAHVRKFELVKGDATATVARYIDEHPETIVALAYLDFDLFEPTKRALEAIRDRLTRGSVVAFDELNVREWPGETLALKEVLGLGRYAIRRDPRNPSPSYIVID